MFRPQLTANVLTGMTPQQACQQVYIFWHRVEFFGVKLDGFHFTEHGWVQSYGSRYVRPPIIYTDVKFTSPMTVKEFKYAQSLTERPVKGMLTGDPSPLSTPLQACASRMSFSMKVRKAGRARKDAGSVCSRTCFERLSHEVMRFTLPYILQKSCMHVHCRCRLPALFGKSVHAHS